jgi:hypothetical protein
VLGGAGCILGPEGAFLSIVKSRGMLVIFRFCVANRAKRFEPKIQNVIVCVQKYNTFSTEYLQAKRFLSQHGYIRRVQNIFS